MSFSKTANVAKLQENTSTPSLSCADAVYVLFVLTKLEPEYIFRNLKYAPSFD